MSIDQTGLGQGSTGAATGSVGANPSTTTGSAGGSGGSPSDMAMTALDQTGAVASGAASAGKDVAHEAKAQASQVVGQAKEQLHTIVGQARTEVRDQFGSKATQAATSLRSFSEQLTALQNGRPEEAGQFATYLGEAQQRMSSLADRLENEGIQGVADDVARFARRRPGMFLLGAVAAGFVIGRTVRAGVAASHESDDQDGSAGMYGGTYGAVGRYDTADWTSTPPAAGMPGSYEAPTGAATSPLVSTPGTGTTTYGGVTDEGATGGFTAP